MTPVTEATLERMVRAIVEEVGPEQVILFGSRARGDQRKDSDIDLIVMMLRAAERDDEALRGRVGLTDRLDAA